MIIIINYNRRRGGFYSLARPGGDRSITFGDENCPYKICRSCNRSITFGDEAVPTKFVGAAIGP
jgi:hypothetical protein